jgi:hypothetical protein
VKGVQIPLKAIALSVKPGAEIGTLHQPWADRHHRG